MGCLVYSTYRRRWSPLPSVHCQVPHARGEGHLLESLAMWGAPLDQLSEQEMGSCILRAKVAQSHVVELTRELLVFIRELEHSYKELNTRFDTIGQTAGSLIGIGGCPG